MCSAPRLVRVEHVEEGLRSLSRSTPELAKAIALLSSSQIEAMSARPAHTAFTSLIKSICSQQLSTKAARTIFTRIQQLVPAPAPTLTTAAIPTATIVSTVANVCPHALHAVPEEELRQAGLSTAKVRSVKDLAFRFVEGTLSETLLANAEDIEELQHLLLCVRGIGPWTVQMFAIFFLRLPDVAVTGDLGVQKGYAKIRRMTKPTKLAMESVTMRWKPYRSLGAMVCWKALDMRDL